MIEFVAPRPKTYSYIMDDDSSKKKAKGTKGEKNTLLNLINSQPEIDKIYSYIYKRIYKKIYKIDIVVDMINKKA